MNRRLDLVDVPGSSLDDVGRPAKPTQAVAVYPIVDAISRIAPNMYYTTVQMTRLGHPDRAQMSSHSRQSKPLTDPSPPQPSAATTAGETA